MLDTVRLAVTPPHAGWMNHRPDPIVWDSVGLIKVPNQPIPEGVMGVIAQTSERLTLRENETLRIGKDFSGNFWAEASLPKLLWGSNGRVISNAAELAAGWDALKSQLATVWGGLGVLRITRADTVWQFRGNVREWVASLRNAKHPRVRRASFEYFGESLHWPGKDVHFRCYDKRLEETGKPGDVVRFEMQGRGKFLKHYLDTEDPLGVPFEHWWRMYRTEMVRFQGVPIPRGKLRPMEILSLAISEGAEIRGISAKDLYAIGRSRRQCYRMNALGKRAIGSWREFDLSEILPELHPPDVVNCEETA